MLLTTITEKEEIADWGQDKRVTESACSSVLAILASKT